MFERMLDDHWWFTVNAGGAQLFSKSVDCMFARSLSSTYDTCAIESIAAQHTNSIDTQIKGLLRHHLRKVGLQSKAMHAISIIPHCRMQSRDQLNSESQPPPTQPRHFCSFWFFPSIAQ
jgi:hypothetical protein